MGSSKSHKTFYFAPNLSYNTVMRAEKFTEKGMVALGQEFINTLPMFTDYDRRRDFREHPEADLDVQFKKLFYIGDFVRTHFSGRKLNDDDDVEATKMFKIFPVWVKKKLISTKNIENGEIVSSLTFEDIEMSCRESAGAYLKTLGARHISQENYFSQYSYFQRISVIAQSAFLMNRAEENRYAVVEAERIMSPTKHQG